MQITEVRIKLMENSEDRLRGFCSVTFDDCFVIRDLKIIEGNNGPFVAMPSRKLTSNCQKCRSKNHLRARYCNHCGARQKFDQVAHDSDGRARLYADIAHPVNAGCREMIQSRVIEEFQIEIKRATEPGYVSRYDDDYVSTEKAPSHKRPEKPQPETSRTDSGENSVPESHADKRPDNVPSGEQSQDSDKDSDKGGFGEGILN